MIETSLYWRMAFRWKPTLTYHRHAKGGWFAAGRFMCFGFTFWIKPS